VQAPDPASGRRAVTPAVILAAAFTTACAVVSITFVAARGGLQLPVAGSPAASAVAAASEAPTPTATTAPSLGPTTAPTLLVATPAPTLAPTTPPTPMPSLDPLAVLPPCPDHPGCYLYTIQRGDTLSTIADHWLIGLTILEVLNPQVTDPGTIVVGETLYLGRSPYVRLDRCPDLPGCYLYVVRPGDRLSTLAGTFGITTTSILALNPQITDPNAIYSGQTLRLPGPT
jgi:LysM domain